MNRLYRKFVCCGGPTHVEPSTITAMRNNGAHLHIEENNIETHENNKEPAKKNLARIESMYCTKKLIYSDFRPKSGPELKYNCPICFRFFDQILVTVCCKNYICHFCVEDLNQRVINDTKVYSALCPFCNTQDVELKDVDPREKPKRYTDSPCTTNKQSFLGSSQYREHLTSKSNFKTRGIIDPGHKIEEVEALNFNNNKENNNELDSGLLESAIGAEHLFNSGLKRCSLDDPFINKIPSITRENRQKYLNLKTTEALNKNKDPCSVIPVERRLFAFDERLPLEDAIGLEATPHLPNCLASKRSYQDE